MTKETDLDTKYTIVIAGSGTVVLVVYFTGSLSEAEERAEILATEHAAGENYHVLEGWVNEAARFETA